MKEEIYYLQLMHYESILIKKLDEISNNYKKRTIIKILSPAIGSIISILGWTFDNIGVKTLNYIMKYFGINLDAAGVSNIVYLAINISLLMPSLYAMFRAQQIKKGITIEFLKEPLNQNKLLTKYIIDKHSDKLPNISNEKDFLKYYNVDLKNTEIHLNKSDFRYYLHEYLDKFHADFDVSRYLAEVIISRRIIAKQMIDLGYEEYKEIISSKNAIAYLLSKDIIQKSSQACDNRKNSGIKKE